MVIGAEKSTVTALRGESVQLRAGGRCTTGIGCAKRYGGNLFHRTTGKGKNMGQRDAQRGLVQGNLRGLPVPDASPAPYFCHLPNRCVKILSLLNCRRAK